MFYMGKSRLRERDEVTRLASEAGSITLVLFVSAHRSNRELKPWVFLIGAWVLSAPRLRVRRIGNRPAEGQLCAEPLVLPSKREDK